MRNFEFINMPDYFTQYLKLDMQVSSKSYSKLKSDLYNHKSLNGIFKKCFADIDPKLDVDMVMKSVGWEGFRNRVAAFYIQYTQTGNFEGQVNDSLCEEILHFENKMKAFSVSGYSRGFLLGFYLKLWSLELAKQKEKAPMRDLFDTSGAVMEILQKSRSRTIELDWVILIVGLLLRYLNKDIVLSMVAEDTDYKELYQVLNEEQKREFLSNLIAYGSSINDQDIFLRQ